MVDLNGNAVRCATVDDVELMGFLPSSQGGMDGLLTALVRPAMGLGTGWRKEASPEGRNGRNRRQSEKVSLVGDHDISPNHILSEYVAIIIGDEPRTIVSLHRAGLSA